MKNFKQVLFISMAGLPLTSFAATDFKTLVNTIVNNVLNPLIGLVIALAMLFFIWGLAKYLKGDAKLKEEAKGVMVFSVLAMFVIFSIWGLVRVLQNTVGITGDETVPIPRITP